jgi:hypothetical protein
MGWRKFNLADEANNILAHEERLRDITPKPTPQEKKVMKTAKKGFPQKN